jgi:predicted RNA-binding Zn ribbon-like protein
MSATPKGATLFDLCGGHPALDFVNSLDNRFREDGPNEMLVSYGDLLRFLEESGLLDGQRIRFLNKTVTSQAGERTLHAARVLREATAAALYASVAAAPAPPADIRVLEKYFLDASRHRELRWEPADRGARGQNPALHAQPGLVWRWGRFETEPDLPVWVLSRAVSEILLSDQIARVRTCAVDTCRWLFLDTSKNHTRRWCNMKVCGNRMKARRFQARREG